MNKTEFEHLQPFGAPMSQPGTDAERPLDRLVKFADVADWDRTCEFAEQYYKPVADHMETWGPHCGAPRDVYRGHLVRMLIDLAKAI